MIPARYSQLSLSFPRRNGRGRESTGPAGNRIPASPGMTGWGHALLKSAALLCIFVAAGARAQEAVINMEATVKGNQEQPTVLYIVPWKPPEGPAALYQSVDSQLQAVFSHVERTEFRRQLQYIKEMSDTQEKQ